MGWGWGDIYLCQNDTTYDDDDSVTYSLQDTIMVSVLPSNIMCSTRNINVKKKKEVH